jgi:divalent metal cation (Fe/Co/Zn/Cd) transporter
MDISLQSLLFFIIITIVYFAFPSIGKPQLTLDDLTSEETKADYYNKNLKSLAFYLGVVIISQLLLNIAYLTAKCGGAIDKNIGAAFIFTFIPWVLIFGVLLAVLVIFPGFKSAFSDVLGYYAVAGSANDLFSSIFIGTDLNDLIDKTNDADKKNELTQAAEAILKICGNKSILINQMNPDNFIDIWKTLKPLMNAGVYEDTNIQTQLLNLVSLKDNIGEAVWYIYTAILISSIVYYNLATRGCVKSVDQIKADRDTYIQQEEEADKQKELDNSTTYVIS